MLTGRSAVHRHTDRQTNSGKNKCPSGFSQIGPTDKHIDGKSENKGRSKKKFFFFDFIDYPTDRITDNKGHLFQRPNTLNGPT